MVSWIKLFFIKRAIQSLDQLEIPIALKIKEAQKKFGEIPSEEFSKMIVDDFQAKLYDWAGVAPEDRPK